MEQKLKSLISGMAPSLGATPDGAAWCMKALHPSDAAMDCRGIPDENSMSTVMMNYQSVFSIGVPAGTGDGWETNIQVTPHPVQFARYNRGNAGGGGVGHYVDPLLNTQLTGADHASKYDALTDLASAWRLAYFGVTVTLDAPMIANQGTVVVCQKPLRPNVFAYGDLSGAPVLANMGRNLCVYNVANFPDYDVSQAMPNAYYGNAKDGVYIPMRLTHTSQEWHGPEDSLVACKDLQTGMTGRELDDDSSVPLDWVAACPGVLGVGTGAMFPGLRIPYAVNLPGNPLHCGLDGDVTSRMLNAYVADICFKGLAEAATVKLFFRVGIELLVEPQSALSSQLHAAVMYDPAAFASYFNVSRQLKDAYPAEYNLLGALWPVIQSAIQLAPRIFPLLRPVGDAIRSVVSAKAAESRAAMSASERERSNAAIVQATTSRMQGGQRQRQPKQQQPRQQRAPAPQFIVLPQQAAAPQQRPRLKIQRPVAQKRR